MKASEIEKDILYEFDPTLGEIQAKVSTLSTATPVTPILPQHSLVRIPGASMLSERPQCATMVKISIKLIQLYLRDTHDL